MSDLDAPKPQTWPKECPTCKRVLDEAAWGCLTFSGYVGVWWYAGLRWCVELRHCICTSTIGIEVRLPMAEASAQPTFRERRDAQVDVATPGEMSNPLTHDRGNRAERRKKWCKCADCGAVDICTPETDFYIKSDGDPLRCEVCYWKRAARRGDQIPALPFKIKPEAT